MANRPSCAIKQDLSRGDIVRTLLARFARCWPLRGYWPEDGLLAAFGGCWRSALHFLKVSE